MGGRALKQRAIDYLNAARDTGQVIQQLTALKIENDALKERNKSLEERLTKLEGAAAKK
jgi:proteasome assembly chaperone (PAC2) family protein